MKSRDAKSSAKAAGHWSFELGHSLVIVSLVIGHLNPVIGHFSLALPKPLHKQPNALLNLYTWRITQQRAGFANIGIGNGNVAGLRRLVIDNRLFSQSFFEHFDQIRKPHGLGLPEIKNLVTEFFLRYGHHAIDDVGHIGVIAGGRAIAEDRDRFSGPDQLSEFLNRQIRTLARAIDSKETK